MSVIADARPSGRRHRDLDLRRVRAPGAVALLGLLVMATVNQLLVLPPRVERITFENRTPYDLAVSASDAGRDRWLEVAIAGQDAATTATEVIDQGRIWVFRLRTQGVEAGEIRRTRDELERDDWRVSIGEGTGEGLRARRVPPSP